MLEVISKCSIEGLASTYTGYVRSNRANLIEFVESTPAPESSKIKKWVIIVSSQIGCKMGCRFCDATNFFHGNLNSDEIVEQVDYILRENPVINPDRVKKFKIQFARMGEPSLNMNVIEAMLQLRSRFNNYIPCVATLAPEGSEEFFERLIRIRDLFIDFQLQFSINSTDERLRDHIMPAKKLSLKWISDYINRFYSPGRRRVVLNFAVDRHIALDFERLRDLFDPYKSVVKLTPVNPTYNAIRNGFKICDELEGIESYLQEIAEGLSSTGFESIISIGDLRENSLFSNCGQIAVQNLRETA